MLEPHRDTEVILRLETTIATRGALFDLGLVPGYSYAVHAQGSAAGVERVRIECRFNATEVTLLVDGGLTRAWPRQTGGFRGFRSRQLMAPPWDPRLYGYSWRVGRTITSLTCTCAGWPTMKRTMRAMSSGVRTGAMESMKAPKLAGS